MPDAPDPIVSPKARPGQPYNAVAPGEGDPQSESAAVYNSSGGSGSGNPWPKIQSGGAASMDTGQVTGDWPGDGASDGSAWKQA